MRCIDCWSGSLTRSIVSCSALLQIQNQNIHPSSSESPVAVTGHLSFSRMAEPTVYTLNKAAVSARAISLLPRASKVMQLNAVLERQPFQPTGSRDDWQLMDQNSTHGKGQEEGCGNDLTPNRFGRRVPPTAVACVRTY